MAGRLGNAAFPAWHIEVRTMKRSKMTAAKNSLSPTMKSRARTKHAIQGEEALAEWAPRLSAANTQKLVRLVRNCGIETVIGVAKEIPVRGLRRLSRGLLTHYENPPAQPADVVVPMLRGA
jgi:hypothetical protein